MAVAAASAQLLQVVGNGMLCPSVVPVYRFPAVRRLHICLGLIAEAAHIDEVDLRGPVAPMLSVFRLADADWEISTCYPICRGRSEVSAIESRTFSIV